MYKKSEFHQTARKAAWTILVAALALTLAHQGYLFGLWLQNR